MTTLHEIIARAVGDPGSIVERAPGESTTEWSTRAVAAIYETSFGVDPEGVYPRTPAAEALLENATLRGRLQWATTLLASAHAVITSAENFKNELVCEHEHCLMGAHEHPAMDTAPVGDEQWRTQANTWGDAWRGFSDATALRNLDTPRTDPKAAGR